jgi:hypothetical protein
MQISDSLLWSVILQLFSLLVKLIDWLLVKRHAGMPV